MRQVGSDWDRGFNLLVCLPVLLTLLAGSQRH